MTSEPGNHEIVEDAPAQTRIMPDEPVVSDATSQALDAIADVMVLPRRALIAVSEDTQWRPTMGSQADRDLTSPEFTEEVNGSLLEMPRVIASLFLRSGSEHLAGMAALFRARECFSAPGALARAAFEHGIRAWWVLDPRRTTRQRSARAILEDLASADYSMKAVSGLVGKDNDEYRTLRDRRQAIREAAETGFAACSFTDDPTKWTIEDQRYPRITEVAEEWGSRRDEPVPGRGVYDHLSHFPHPQGLAGRQDVFLSEREPSGTALVAEPSHLARIASAALAAWFDGATLLCSYHGFDHPAMQELERASEVLVTLGGSPDASGA